MEINDILTKSIKNGLSGGSAMVFQVSTLMWLRTTMNYQFKNGGGTWDTIKLLYKDGGIPRFYRGYLLDEGSLNYVYFDKSEANKFKKKVEPFVDSVEMERSIAGHFNVMVKGEKKDLKRATDIAIKMSEEIEPLGEAKKGKYKSKNQNKVLAQMKKILSREKKAKDGSGDDKRIDDFMKAYKKGFETEMYDDMEILTRRSLKDIDKIFSKMVNSQNEQELAAVLQKHDPDFYDMMFGF